MTNIPAIDKADNIDRSAQTSMPVYSLMILQRTQYSVLQRRQLFRSYCSVIMSGTGEYRVARIREKR